MQRVWPLKLVVGIVVLACAVSVLAGGARAEGMKISAKAAVVMDAATGDVIISKDMHRKLPPASTAKVMTAILALENTNMYDWFRVSRRAAAMEPTKVNLLPGDRVTVEALMYALLLKSANDAAAALAEGISGTEDNFARTMTSKARQIGALNTEFRNASGLPNDDQYTTAYDLALILRYATQKQSFMDIESTRFATLNMGEKKELALKNSNKLLWLYEGAVAGKTGYTRNARTCYVGAVDCNGRRLIVSLLNSVTRWEDVTKLLNTGFELAERGETMEIEPTAKDEVVQKSYKHVSSHKKHKKKSRRARSKSKKHRKSGRSM